MSDFSKQLDLSAKNSKFTNNTLKIIEELNNGVKQASEEIKEKATKYEKALKELQKIDESKLSKEQQQVLKVFKGELDQAEIKGIDLNDLYILEQGTRKAGTKKILIKHYGVENTGGLTNEELLNMGEVIKNGSVTLDSFKKLADGFRYAYEWYNNGAKLRLVVDDLDSGNKIFDFYSDRNFTDFKGVSRLPEITLNASKNTDEKIINQKPLTSQEDLLRTQENTLKNTQTPLSPLEQANAEKLAKLESDKLESALFFKQISQYAKGLRLKILSAPSSKKGLQMPKEKELENMINQEEERLKAKDLNALEQENALKLKESIKAKQNYTETLKNAINQKKQAKNSIEQQKQNLESQRNEKEREKQNQEHDKRNKEQERNNLNNEINAIGNERLTFKQLGTPDNFLGVQPYLNNNGWGRTYARAVFSDKNKSIREYYDLENRIKNILGFYRIGESDERILYRFLELPPHKQNELASLLLQ
ncbi:DUF3519 domain-containing protein [Helicobacter pylori]|uniref:DUF3519 domain-containing protein n=1 Tax=Helicobacter pylori TaxID=210 RepID=UPI0009B597BD|nr:DUF3519 domain-containing protein [Helicobacter pylori]